MVKSIETEEKKDGERVWSVTPMRSFTVYDITEKITDLIYIFEHSALNHIKVNFSRCRL